jgi:ATP-dependent helicase/nuclease subunit A
MNIADLEVRARAARDFSRNLVVVAGAGTGKTSLLTERLLHLVLERGVPLAEVAAMTFTTKAAAEMRERLEEALARAVAALAGARRGGAAAAGRRGEEADRVLSRLRAEDGGRGVRLERARAALEALDEASITTIHGYCAELLRRHPDAAGVDPGFQVDDGLELSACFDELWPAHLEAVFGGPSSVGLAAWEKALAVVGIEDIEKFARSLVNFAFDRRVLDGSEDERQRLYLLARARALEGEVERLRSALRGVGGVLSRFLETLGQIESILASIEETSSREPDRLVERLRARLDELPGSGTVGKKAELDERTREEIDGAMVRLLKDVEELGAVDATVAGAVLEAARPFVETFRREYLGRGWVSFDGVIVLARNLLRDHPEIRRREGDRLAQLLIDEFQDNDPLQYEIAFFLAEAQGSAARDAYEARLVPGKLFIVGDPKQSIFGFRGADILAYHRAVEALRASGGEVLRLSTNFRSVPELIEPINDLFQGYFCDRPLDPDFEPLRAARPAGGGTRIEILAASEKELKAAPRRAREAEVAAQWIQRRADGGRAWKDIAILLRKFSDLDAYLGALRRRGIPHVAAGGKGFYERHEVAILLAFLRAVVNPADPVALIGWLRSPAAGVPDRELQRHAWPGGGGKRRGWNLFSEADASAAPHLAQALRRLAEFHRRHRGRPIDVLARAALSETPLRLAMAAAHQGAQRVANLEKAVRRIAQLAAAGRLSAEEVLDHIDVTESELRDQGDSPLADETVDAVRVLTIHAAKGLEWPTVIVPDLAAKPPKGDTSGFEVWLFEGTGGLPPALAWRGGGSMSPAYAYTRRREEDREAAEAKRIFYVALTRAREELVLVAGLPEKGHLDRSWLAPLKAWGAEIAGAAIEPAGRRLHGGQVLLLRPLDEPPPGAAPRAQPARTLLLDAVNEFRKARQSAAAAAEPWLRHPSGERERRDASVAGEDGGGGAAPAPAGAAAGGATARAAGSAVHLLLEAWESDDSRWLIDRAGRAARVAAAREGADPAEVEGRVRDILDRARREGVLETIARAPFLARELPVLFRDAEGRIWEGSIDAVLGPDEDPEIIDYKTGVERALEDLEAEHRGQLEAYRDGVRRALGREAPPRARIVPLPGGADRALGKASKP